MPQAKAQPKAQPVRRQVRPKPTPAVDPRQALLRAAGVDATKAAGEEPLPAALTDLETLLKEQTTAYRDLAGLLDEGRAAMSDLRLGDLTKLTERQLNHRDRLVALERRRVALTRRLAGPGKNAAELTVAKLAERYPQRRKVLLALRDQLKAATRDAQHRSKLAGGVAGGVLGHLSTAVRLIDEVSGLRPTYDGEGGQVRLRRRAAVEAVA